MQCGWLSSKTSWKDLLMHGADKRMTQPEAMKTNAYVGGVEKVNGHDDLEAGADINARGIEFDETPLATAVPSWRGNKEPELAERRRQMVEFLLKRGAATNLPDDEPWATPLAWARKLELADIEEILQKHGAT
jgi:hypothetical protein